MAPKKRGKGSKEKTFAAKKPAVKKTVKEICCTCGANCWCGWGLVAVAILIAWVDYAWQGRSRWGTTLIAIIILLIGGWFIGKKK